MIKSVLKFLNDMNERGYILKHIVFNPITQAMRYYHFTGEEYQETELEKKHRIREWKKEGVYDGKLSRVEKRKTR